MSQPRRQMRALLLIALLPMPCLVTPSVTEAQIEVEAVSGEPFGVGCVELTLPEPMQPEPLGLEGLRLFEAGGRVLYPAIDTGELSPVLQGVQDLLGRSRRPAGRLAADLLDVPPKTRIYFLFKGDAPLELTLQSRRSETFLVTPTARPSTHRRLLRRWWRRYTASGGWLSRLLDRGDCPPQVENYLKAMLARRLGLELPEEAQDGSSQDRLVERLGLLVGAESVRLAMERERMLGGGPLGERADQPLPARATVAGPTMPEVPEVPGDVEIEPLAGHLPAECFYVRFGSFSNYLWVRGTLARWGGDARNLIALRGLRYDLAARMEQSLVLKQTALARLLGSTAVADMALVGTDLFFRDGGSFGLLFQARNNLMLGGSIRQQRAERLQKGDGATDQTIQVGGHDVSFLSSPDGSVRSFYVVDGDFHFVTRSKTLVKRFLEAGAGKGALSQSKDFRSGRSLMPLARNDTVFVYLSDAFFRSFTGPPYRVESVRRMQAAADAELVRAAVAAAAAEGKPNDTIEQLIAEGLLPPDFGVRPDGSRAVLEDGQVYDSVRGRRGAFIPVPDVEVRRVSPSEADSYRRFCDFYRSNWEPMEPIVIGARRRPLEGNRERIVLDARMKPFAKESYRKLRERLGPADTLRLAPLAADAIAAEAVLTNERVFAAVREIRPPSGAWLRRPVVRTALETFVGYVGTTGEQGFLDLLGVALGGPPNAAGGALAREGIGRRQSEEFTVFSFQSEVLAEAASQLHFEEAERPAQIRLRVDDLSAAKITPTLNDLLYGRTRQTSLSNLRLLHQFDQQLHVPGKQCKEAAERLLGAELICPLGGRYVWREARADKPPVAPGYWTSTALGAQPAGGLFRARAPEGFVAPPLSWFRGLEADVLVAPAVMSLHAELVMQMPAERPATQKKE